MLQSKNLGKVAIKHLLRSHNVAVATHTNEKFKVLWINSPQACQDFGPTISLKKTKSIYYDMKVAQE